MAINATVFVVDDDPGVRRSMKWLLESYGLSVETYSSGPDFLDTYDPSRPGCLMLDLQMPRMDGLELQERLAARGARSPVIFVSGHGSVRNCVKAMTAGAVDFLEKPSDDERVLNVVHRSLEKDRQRRCVEASHTQITARLNRLTPREREVMELLYEGEAMKNIAGRLDISIQTVAKHRTKALDKLQVRNEAELARLLADYGSWLDCSPTMASWSDEGAHSLRYFRG